MRKDFSWRNFGSLRSRRSKVDISARKSNSDLSECSRSEPASRADSAIGPLSNTESRSASRSDEPAKSLKRRALLYIPASSQKMREKVHSLTVDSAVFDIEDSVAEDQKAQARQDLKIFLNGPRPSGAGEIGVRINGVDTIHALQDLLELLPTQNLDTIVVPKVNSPSDLHFINEMLEHVLPDRHPKSGQPSHSSRPPIRVIAMIETAKGIVNIKDICGASPYLSGLIFAAEDYSRDVGITRTEGNPELLHARSTIVAHARAFDLPSVLDMACTAYKGEDGQRRLLDRVVNAKNMGFDGKQCLHPDQIETVQKGFAPSPKELEWAMRARIANRKAVQQGRGAWSLDGKVVNVAVARGAEAVLAKAANFDIDLAKLEAQWKHQEPE